MNSTMRWESVTWLILLLLDVLTLILVVVLGISTPSRSRSGNASASLLPVVSSVIAQTPEPVATATPTDDGAAGIAELTPEPEAPGDDRRCIVFAAQAADAGVVDAAKLDGYLSRIQALDPDMVFLLGNMVVGSSDTEKIGAQYRDLGALLEKRFLLYNIFPAIGAREALPAGRTSIAAFDAGYPELSPHSFTPDNENYHLRTDYSRSVYFVDGDNIRTFVLNTRFFLKQRQVSPSVLHWIRQNIDPTKRFTVFALYDAPYPVGTAVGSALDAYPEQRDAFWALVCEVPGAIVVSGGEATYARREMPTGTAGGTRAATQIITGGLGAASMGTAKDAQGVLAGPIGKPHFLALYPSENDLEGIAYDMEGHEIDRFAIAP